MIVNLRTGHHLAEHPVWALSFAARFRGMMLRRFPRGGFDAMVFPRCAAIHTCFMLMPIDVIFLDSGSRVTAFRRRLRPWRLAGGGKNTVTTLELPPGTLEPGEVRIGDVINLNSTLSPEAIENLRSGCMLWEGRCHLPFGRVRKSGPSKGKVVR